MYASSQGNPRAIQALGNPISGDHFNLTGFVGRSHLLPIDHGGIYQALPASNDPDPLAFQSVETSIGTRHKAFNATGRLSSRGSLAAVFDPPSLQTFRPPCTLGSQNECRFMDNKFVRTPASETTILPQSQSHPFSGEMAISLRSDVAHDSSSRRLPPLHAVTGAERPQSTLQFIAQLPHSEEETRITRVREKKHPCWMCHKSFDRPSTLRKHLLVHTGEKAFVCNTCGRRFGVASNLNRHVRRCILRPVNSRSPPATQTSDKLPSDGGGSEAVPVSPEAQPSCDSAATDAVSTTVSSPPNSAAAVVISGEPTTASSSQTGKRVRASSSDNAAIPQGRQPAPMPIQRPKPIAKRRRRAPSPSRWIPYSLLAFDLCPVEATKATSVPLPPVMPAREHPFEERNSWDATIGRRPYHPKEWRGKLPGPGFVGGLGLGRDLGSFVMGRLIMS